MKRVTVHLLYLLFAGVIMALSIAGPERVARYRDQAMLEEIHLVTADTEGEGYRYTLSAVEKLHILSESLSSQTLSDSLSSQNMSDGQGGRTVSGSGSRGSSPQFGEAGYEELKGAYAFILNHRGPSGREITDSQIYGTCSRELEELKKMGILPESVRNVPEQDYDAVLYSAIDVLEPRNNVAVWKLSLSSNQTNTDKENRLIDVYIDADDGKIYEFYARTPLLWQDTDPDRIVKAWSSYMGLNDPVPYAHENPLMEATPYFKKYVFGSEGEEETIVTVGFYEGINELFLKISR